MKQTLAAFFLFLFALTNAVFSQNILPCDSDLPVTGAPDCRQTCVLCDLNGVEDVTLAPTGATQPVIASCTYGNGAFVLENPRWYAFTAGSTFLWMNIKVLSSASGAGIQAAIVENCGNILSAKSCVSAGTLAAPLDFIVDGLVVGTRYFLVVDGVNGDICRYQMAIFQGTTIPPELGNMGQLQGPTEVCPKATVTYSIAPVDYALSYIWTSPALSKINGGTNTRIIAAPGGTSVEVEFGAIGGSVCVTATNACDTAKTRCLTVTNKALAITQLPERILCYEELPFFWEESPGTMVAAPGTYTLTSSPYESYLGCDSVVRQKVVALPRKQKFLPPQWLCEGECVTYNGFSYCESGTYSEIIEAEDGCDSTINFILVKIPVHAAVKPADTITCRITSVPLVADTSITVGTTVAYLWINNNGDTLSQTTTATATAPGTYHFIVSNHGGGRLCYDTATVVVPGDLAPPVANAGPSKVLNCEMGQTQLQGSGSTGSQFSYLWIALNGGNIVSGAATLTPTVNAPGTYRLRVTDEHNGCTSTSQVVVTAQTLPPGATGTGGTYTCNQPTVTLQGATNSTNATFAWAGPNSFSSALQNPVVNVAGNYLLTVTDTITGCTSTAQAVVTANVDPPGATALGDTLTCADTTVVLSGSSTAATPTFAWTGPNGFSSALANPVVNTQGAYVLTVTGSNGCKSTAAATVLLNNTLPGASLAVSGNLNCKNATVNLTASSTAPPGLLNHTWTLPGGASTSTGTLPVLSAPAPGLYNLVVTNTQNGCTSTAGATVLQSPAVSAAITAAANVTCAGLQNGSTTALGSGGTGVFTYSWNNSANTATLTNLGNGAYTVTVTDGELCTATASVTITQPPVLMANVTATAQMANAAADGTASANPAGGTPAYSFAWSNSATSATINGLLPGVYTVTITDANGCTTVGIASVGAYNCTMDAEVVATDVSCFNAGNGQASVNAISGVAPFSYTWTTGESTPSVANLAPGIYTVVVTDAANCPEAISFTISEPNLLKANATATNTSGPATNDGTASAGPTGGVGPYAYLWNNAEVSASISNLAPGIYTVTVTDHNGCTAVQTVEVLAGNCGLTVNFITVPVQCNGEASGSATVVLNGGAAPFSYTWSPSGGNAATANNLAAGTYNVTITDVNNCEVTDQVTVTEPPALTIALESVVHTACPDLPEGAATVNVAGGTGSLDVTWSDGQTGATATGLVAGTYTATVMDGNSCTKQVSATIQAIDLEAPVVATDSVTAALGTAGNVTLSVQNLGIDVSDNCAIQDVNFQPASYNCAQLGPHAVLVTATDQAGNVTVDTIIVTVVDNLPPSLLCPASIIRCFGDDIVQYPAPVATDNCLGNGGMFALVSGLPSGSTFPQGTTTNTYTYTDADGNVGACTFEVTILSQLQLQLDTILPDKGGLHIGGVQITVNGSLSPYAFQWFFNGNPIAATSEDLDSLGSGAYSVIITDEIGCTATGGPFVVDSLVGTHTVPAWANGLLIVPNPTSGQLYVIFPDQLNDVAQLTVFDLTGRLVQRQVAQAPKEVAFDLSALPDGLYTVLVRVQDAVIARKIVVSR